MADLELSHLDKGFSGNPVVKDLSLNIARGEFVSLLGPSGCGKTTVLRMVAGFERPDKGRIVIGGQDVTDSPASARNIGMVFQAYALFPNLTVGDNVAFGLKVKGVAADKRKERVAALLQMIGLPDLASRYPYQLSGGQQQRVALARALAPEPRVLLLDEPLSALDAKVRVNLRAEIRSIQRKLGITTIFVTHDQEEALSISDRIVVMNEGRIEQAGTAFDIYNTPGTRFVANFVGALNSFTVNVRNAGKGVVALEDKTFPIPSAKSAKEGSSIVLGLRPEALRIGRGAAGDVVLPAEISDVQFMGSVLRLRANVGGQSVIMDTFNRPNGAPPQTGHRIDINFSPKDAFVLRD